MALIVGTNSYISLEDANSYFQAYTNSAWTGDDSAKESALMKATKYIDNNYVFIGSYITGNELAFPRSGVVITTGNKYGKSYDSETIPDEVKDATCEIAVYALTNVLKPNKEAGFDVKKSSVGSLSEEYDINSSSDPIYKTASDILECLLDQNYSNSYVKPLSRW